MKNNIKIGVLKEDEDKRAIFIPNHLKLLTSKYDFFIEENLGCGIGVNNDDYKLIGAKICSKEDVWKKSDVLFKYKKPTCEDIDKFGENKFLFSLLHPEGDYKLVDKLNEKKLNSFSFEYFKKDGMFPLAYVGGQVAGKMSVFYANHFLQSHFGGLGKTLFSVDGADPVHMLVIGHGHAGSAAITTALKFGCEVTVLGKNYHKFKKQGMCFDQKVNFIYEDELCEILPRIDVIIGAILISTDLTKAIIDKDKMSLLKKGAVIIDVTCGYGKGYLPELFDFTSLTSPIKKTNTGQIYCKIDNMPSAYPKTTSQAYSKQISEIIPEIIEHINKNSESEFVESGHITCNGVIVHEGVKNDLKYLRENTK